MVACGVVGHRIRPSQVVVARTSGLRLDAEHIRVETCLAEEDMESIGRRVVGKLGSRRRWKDL